MQLAATKTGTHTHTHAHTHTHTHTHTHAHTHTHTHTQAQRDSLIKRKVRQERGSWHTHPLTHKTHVHECDLQDALRVPPRNQETLPWLGSWCCTVWKPWYHVMCLLACSAQKCAGPPESSSVSQNFGCSLSCLRECGPASSCLVSFATRRGAAEASDRHGKATTPPRPAPAPTPVRRSSSNGAVCLAFSILLFETQTTMNGHFVVHNLLPFVLSTHLSVAFRHLVLFFVLFCCFVGTTARVRLVFFFCMQACLLVGEGGFEFAATRL